MFEYILYYVNIENKYLFQSKSFINIKLYKAIFIY